MFLCMMMFFSTEKANAQIELFPFGDEVLWTGTIPGAGATVTSTNPYTATISTYGLAPDNFTCIINQSQYGDFYGNIYTKDGSTNMSYYMPWGAFGNTDSFWDYGNGYYGDFLTGNYWNNFNGGDYGGGNKTGLGFFFGFFDNPFENMSHLNTINKKYNLTACNFMLCD